MYRNSEALLYRLITSLEFLENAIAFRIFVHNLIFAHFVVAAAMEQKIPSSTHTWR